MALPELVRRGTELVLAAGLLVLTIRINLQIVKQAWNWMGRELTGMVWTMLMTLGATGLISLATAPRLVPWEIPFMGMWAILFVPVSFFTVFVPSEWRRQRGIAQG